MSDKAIAQIKIYHAQLVELQVQARIKQAQILGIVELMDWDETEANKILGVEMFRRAEPEPEPPPGVTGE